MQAPRSVPSSGEMWVSTANDRLKAQWDTVLGWSTVFAVFAHVAAFVLWPSWMLPDPAAAMAFEREPVAWLTLRDLGSTPESEAFVVTAPVGIREDPISTGISEDSITGGAGEEDGSELGSTLAGLSEALLDRLRQGSFLRPTITEPEATPMDAEPPGDQSEDESLSIEGDASTAALESLPVPDALDLDRLSALQPQLSLTSVSAWVLVRNPQQVVDFILRSYRQGDLSAEAQGTVSVTLWIDRTGSVEWSELKESSGNQMIDEFVLELFNQVVSFRPAREEGVPVARSVIFIVPFPWI